MLSCILPALTQARFAVGTGMAGCAGRIHQREHSLPRTALIILMTLTQRVSCETEVSVSPEDPLILSEQIYGRISEKATKYCGEDGQWFRHPDTNRTWSNYTLCNENTKAKLKVIYNEKSFQHTKSAAWLLL